MPEDGQAVISFDHGETAEYDCVKGREDSVARDESREPMSRFTSACGPWRVLISGEGANVWSQPLRAAAARSSLAMTRSCNFAIRSLILRPDLMSCVFVSAASTC